ncbi:MAG: hypothetical protein CMK72_20270 [Pseudomonadaceae bacterium]|uniref:hypothetical protein n=1 Tax=Pseudomonas TaxID=286 RepID=UPI000B84084F|nr:MULTISPECIES: hypothetical protein [Pseudomonas]MAB96602.1 hypothetical protein [Pseudomonadaceae bacterium]MBQ57215.1 hypothetical protein [Pseudomonadaceae bacterium]HCP55855.1 hypothetical protein [Pseudomonas sp.]
MLFSTMVVSLAGGHDVGSGKRSVSGAPLTSAAMRKVHKARWWFNAANGQAGWPHRRGEARAAAERCAAGAKKAAKVTRYIFEITPQALPIRGVAVIRDE